MTTRTTARDDGDQRDVGTRARRWLGSFWRPSGAPLALVDGIVAAVAFGVPLVLALAIDQLQLGLVASPVAAMVIASAPRQLRAPDRIAVMVAATVASAAVMFCAGLVAGAAWASALYIGAIAVAGGLLALLGPRGAVLGGLVGPVALMVLTATTVTVHQAVDIAIAAAAGGTWAIVVGLVAATVRGERVEGRALRQLFANVAAAADALADGDVERFRTVRAANGTALTAALLTEGPGDRSQVELAISIELGLVETSTGSQPLADDAVAALRALGEHLRRAPGVDLPPELHAALTDAGLDAVADAGVRHRDTASAAIDRAAQMFSPHVVFANLRWTSPSLRYAARSGVTVAAAFFVPTVLDIPNGTWIALTALLVLRADLGATTDRVAQRLVGTIVGALVGGVAAWAIGDQTAALAAVALGAVVVMVAAMQVNYLYWTFAVTILIVVLLALDGDDAWSAVGWRMLNTLIGGAVALGASFLVWPVRRRDLLPGLAASSIDAVADEIETIARAVDQTAGQTVDRTTGQTVEQRADGGADGQAELVGRRYRAVTSLVEARSAARAAAAEPADGLADEPADGPAADWLALIDAATDAGDQALRLSTAGQGPSAGDLPRLRAAVADLRTAASAVADGGGPAVDSARDLVTVATQTLVAIDAPSGDDGSL